MMQKIFLILMILSFYNQPLAFAESNCESKKPDCKEAKQDEYNKWEKMTPEQKKIVTESIANTRVEVE